MRRYSSFEDWPPRLAIAARLLAHEIDPGNYIDSPVTIITTFIDRTTFSDKEHQ